MKFFLHVTKFLLQKHKLNNEIRKAKKKRFFRIGHRYYKSLWGFKNYFSSDKKFLKMSNIEAKVEPGKRWKAIAKRRFPIIKVQLRFSLWGHSNITWHSGGEVRCTTQCHQMPRRGGRGLAKVSRDIFSKFSRRIFEFWHAFFWRKKGFFGKSWCHVTPGKGV